MISIEEEYPLTIKMVKRWYPETTHEHAIFLVEGTPIGMLDAIEDELERLYHDQ